MLNRRTKVNKFDIDRLEAAHRERQQYLSTVYVHGPAWEREAIQELRDDYALRTPSSKSPAAKKRSLGAKAVKNIEHQHEPGGILSPHEATTFRALSARANFLAQDKPDLAFACKELCRHGPCPTPGSLGNEPRLVRSNLA